MPLDPNENEGQAPKVSPAVVDESAPVILRPKKKKKYSRNRRTIQELEVGVTDSARRLSKAVKDGLDTYIEERDKSAKKKRDGAIRDLLRNQSKAMRKGLSIAAEAPADFMDAVANLKVIRRMTK